MSEETMAEHGASGNGHGAEGGESALTVVTSLMQERRKYESWLEALEARRATTPARVFTRVHADYSARLDVVLEELTTHSDGLRAELASLTSRLAEIDEQQQLQRDERAEAELRAHVGELSSEAWQEIASTADKSIDQLTGKHTDLERELSRTRELLNEAERPPTPRGAAAVPPEPQQVAAIAAPAAVEPAVAQAPVAPESAMVEDRRDARPPEPVAAPGASELPAELPASVIAAEAQLTSQSAEVASAPERRDADVTPPPTQRADASRVSGQTAGTFDELAFLSSVVDTPTSTVDVPAPTERGDERARRDSFAQRGPEDDIVNLANGAGTLIEGAAARTSPLAMNVTGNIPIVIKEKTAEASKSLKCGECGSLNYPTEWYCERCGAELASL